MKKLFFLLITICTTAITAKAGSFTNDSSSLSPLLNLYYQVKDALVTGNSESAAVAAGEFVKAINGIDMKTLPAGDHAAFMSLHIKLAFDARHISESKEITHQREHFKSFSDNFYTLAKKVKLSREPVYQQYCPMKKAYWLSNEEEIKNPYFGNQMLTCGKVTAKLK